MRTKMPICINKYHKGIRQSRILKTGPERRGHRTPNRANKLPTKLKTHLNYPPHWFLAVLHPKEVLLLLLLLGGKKYF